MSVRAAVLALGLGALHATERPVSAATVCAGVAERYVIAPAATDPAIDDPPQNHLAFITQAAAPSAPADDRLTRL